jgi:drug/metabolite transporter (DMT)-like permease
MAPHVFENGVVIMLAASVFFAVFDALAKYLTSSFPVAEIAIVRFAFGVLMTFHTLFKEKSWLDKRDFFLLILRGLSGIGTFYLTLLAFELETLSVTMILFFTNPLWSLLLSTYFLDESLTWERIVCIVIAILGITILINPLGRGITLSHLYGLGAGILGGLNNVLARHLRARNSARVMYAFQCMIGTLLSLPLVIHNLHVPELTQGGILLVAAAFGLLGQVTMNHGFRFIRAPEGGTLVMFEAVLTAALGIILFREPLSLRFVLGTVMILGSGIYLGLRTGRSVIGAEGDSISVSR